MLRKIVRMTGSVIVACTAATAASTWAETTTEDCLYARNLEQFEVLNNEMILIYGKFDRVWLNRLSSRCAGLRDNMQLTIERYGSQICANDRITARRHGDMGAAAICRLGEFETLDKEQIPALKQSLAET